MHRDWMAYFHSNVIYKAHQTIKHIQRDKRVRGKSVSESHFLCILFLKLNLQYLKKQTDKKKQTDTPKTSVIVTTLTYKIVSNT